MKWTGRISFAATFGFLSYLFCVQAYNTFIPSAILEHANPVEIKYWDFKRKPLEQMVDITNGLALKVLAEHDYLNLNNIAFSPYGLMGILVALYEGVDGATSFQIQRSLHLPRDRAVVRIGFRDIHRALKTYFVPEEGFLAGLALNNDNVIFTERYISTLRFYGFDLQDTIVTSTSATNATSSESTSSAPSTTDGISDITTTQSTKTKGETSTQETPLATSTFPTTNSETTAMEQSDTETTTIQTEANTRSTNAQSTSSTTPTDSAQTTESTIAPPTTITTTEASTTQTDTTTEPLTTPFTTETASTPITTTSQDDTTSTQAATDSDQTSTNSTILETLQRKKKSIIDFSSPDMDYSVENRAFKVGQDKTEDDIKGESMFMVNGLRKIEVPYTHYDTVLDYAYLPHLEASALRLPLDSERYYLLIVLPNRVGPREISRLLARMARESDLSDVYGALRPHRVRALVPSFVVKGHVILTTDLQKLGINDVFEPRQRDFTPMTTQPGVYVRSIEQAVSVSIRKYQPDELCRYVSKRRRISFSASYPFLYFVMDASINVSLMAGKLVDPLNSRIL